jgi:hypothetical protein
MKDTEADDKKLRPKSHLPRSRQYILLVRERTISSVLQHACKDSRVSRVTIAKSSHRLSRDRYCAGAISTLSVPTSSSNSLFGKFIDFGRDLAVGVLGSYAPL